MASWQGVRAFRGSRWGKRGGRGGGALLSALAVGSALAYFFDPNRGRVRRARVADQARKALRREEGFLDKARRDLRNRALGVVADARSVVSDEAVPDGVLAARVRSELGRAVRHPRAIDVEVREGQVTLHGPVLANEVAPLFARVKRVRGVREVVSKLEAHPSARGVPALQGAGRPRGSRPELLQTSWSPAVRVLAGAAGAWLALHGRRRRDGLGLVETALGAWLAARAATNLPTRRLLGVGAGARAIDVQKTLLVDAPIDEVFPLWANIEEFPRFMEHVREVTLTGPGRSRWHVVNGLGLPISFEVEITELQPNDRIAWKTVGGSLVQHEGVLQFEEEADRSTRLTLRMSYNPVLGALGHAAARLVGADPKRAIDEDLLRFKSLVERGKTRAHGEPVTLAEIEDEPSWANGSGRSAS